MSCVDSPSSLNEMHCSREEQAVVVSMSHPAIDSGAPKAILAMPVPDVAGDVMLHFVIPAAIVG